MIEVVIKYDDNKQSYLIYEPNSDTLMASTNLTEALVMLNKLLLDKGLSKVDILQCPDISYHIDSKTMSSIVEGNRALLKRLSSAPSGFMISNQRFGGQQPKRQDSQPSFESSGGKKKKNRSSGFTNAAGFKAAFKKFGGNKF